MHRGAFIIYIHVYILSIKRLIRLLFIGTSYNKIQQV